MMCLPQVNKKQQHKQGGKQKRQNKDTQVCQPKAKHATKYDDTKLAKKETKLSNITTKQIALSNWTNITSPARNKK